MILLLLVAVGVSGFIVALVYGVLWIIVHGINLVLQTVLFLLILFREHWEETAARRQAGAEDHRWSWRFVRRVFRDFRAGVYERELEAESHLR